MSVDTLYPQIEEGMHAYPLSLDDPSNRNPKDIPNMDFLQTALDGFFAHVVSQGGTVITSFFKMAKTYEGRAIREREYLFFVVRK